MEDLGQVDDLVEILHLAFPVDAAGLAQPRRNQLVGMSGNGASADGCDQEVHGQFEVVR